MTTKSLTQTQQKSTPSQENSAGSKVPRPRQGQQKPADTQVIRLVPQLNTAALSARPRQDKQLMLWYILRSIDSDTGRGVLKIDMAIEILMDQYGYQRQTARKHLAAGDGVYWHIHHSTRNGQTYIIINSLLKVAVHLGADITRKTHFIEVEVSELPDSSHTQERRAILYNTGAYRPFEVRRNDPISRQSLERKTGVNTRTQQRYDAAQDVKGNLIKQETKAYIRDQADYKLRKHIRIIDKGHYMVETVTLPNRYRTPYPSSSRGILRNVSSMLNRGDKSLLCGEANAAEGRQRLYYSGWKAFLHAHQRGQTGERVCYYPCKSNDSKYVLGGIW